MGFLGRSKRTRHNIAFSFLLGLILNRCTIYVHVIESSFQTSSVTSHFQDWAFPPHIKACHASGVFLICWSGLSCGRRWQHLLFCVVASHCFAGLTGLQIITVKTRLSENHFYSVVVPTANTGQTPVLNL